MIKQFQLCVFVKSIFANWKQKEYIWDKINKEVESIYLVYCTARNDTELPGWKMIPQENSCLHQEWLAQEMLNIKDSGPLK